MTASMDTFLFLFAVVIAVSFPLLWQWDRKMQRKKKDAYRRQAYERLVSYRSRSDYPKYEFSGKDAAVVLRKEKFVPKDGQLAGTFIFLCRNAFDEYFFCVIDISLSAIHIPRERALLFLKDFPEEYALETAYLANS